MGVSSAITREIVTEMAVAALLSFVRAEPPVPLPALLHAEKSSSTFWFSLKSTAKTEGEDEYYYYYYYEEL